MTLLLMTLDYEHLASDELKRAALCHSDDDRTRHLNRAAAYARRAGKAGAGATRSVGVLDLIGNLSAALDDADVLGLSMTAMYINQAVIDLGGIGTSPPEGDDIY